MWQTELLRNKQQVVPLCLVGIFLIFQNCIEAHSNAIITLRLSIITLTTQVASLNSCSNTILNPIFLRRITNNDYDDRNIWNLMRYPMKTLTWCQWCVNKEFCVLPSGAYCLWTFWEHQRHHVFSTYSVQKHLEFEHIDRSGSNHLSPRNLDLGFRHAGEFELFAWTQDLNLPWGNNQLQPARRSTNNDCSQGEMKERERAWSLSRVYA